MNVLPEHDRPPERKSIDLTLLDDARRALVDITAGRTQDANAAIEKRLQHRRK